MRTARQRHERLLLFVLTAVQFTHIMDFMILMPLGSFLMRTFGLTAMQFSHLVAAYGLAAAVSGFAGGFFIDRIDRRRALLILYAGFTLATLACALAPTYGLLLLARLAAGAFGGLAGAVVTAAVGDAVPPERRGAALGLVMTAFPLASVLGVPTGLALAGWFEWHAPFWFLAGASAIIGLIAWRILPALPAHPVTAGAWTQMRGVLTHGVHVRGFMLSAMVVFGGGVIIPFMAPTMVANAGLAETQLPLIYLCGGACTFFTMPWFGRLSDRHDKLRIFLIANLFAAAVVLVLTRLAVVPVFVALAVTTLFMIGMSARFPPAMSLITNAVEARYRGGFMSVNSAVQQASGAAANTLAGILVTLDPVSGRLEGYPVAGYVSVGAFALAVGLAARLRESAPHAAAPGGIAPR